MKTLALACAAVLLLMTAGSSVSEEPIGPLSVLGLGVEEPLMHIVHADKQTTESLGFDVIDDYSTFVTARLPASDVPGLLGIGVVASPVETNTGRGAFLFDPSEGLPVLPAGMETEDTDYHIVKFRGPVMPQWRETLEAHADVFDYLPAHAFLVRADEDAAAALQERPEVQAVTPYAPGFKVQADLWQARGTLEFVVFSYMDTDLDETLDALDALGATILHSHSNPWEHHIRIEADVGLVPEIARIEEVSWIEEGATELTFDNAEASAISQSGQLNSYPIHDQGVDGSSQLISYCDTGLWNSGGPDAIAPIHELFSDPDETLVWNEFNPDHRKVPLYYAPTEDGQIRGGNQDFSGHGTHVGGTIAGDAGVHGVRGGNDGVAFNAGLIVCDIASPGFHILNDYSNYWDPAYEVGARINSNSWGTSHTIEYTQQARQHDQYVWEYRDFIILRSMGNIGHTIRPEAVAKSAFGIGATQNGAGMENLASFSGTGPTADGRLKPDVVAPGQCLWSASRSISGYSCLSGTSMSTPAVAGAAGLIRDYFEKGYYPDGAPGGDPHNPSTALVRALLYASGDEITGALSHAGYYNGWGLPPEVTNTLGGIPGTPADTFPNTNQGWGRVNLQSVLPFNADDRRLVAIDEAEGLITGGVDLFALEVGAGEPLKINLAWSDYPGTVGALQALVNDLDLLVITPAGLPLFGNNWAGSESVPGLPDRVNIAEGVHLENPVPGTYLVSVIGVNVPEGPQPYAVTATGIVDQVELI